MLEMKGGTTVQVSIEMDPWKGKAVVFTGFEDVGQSDCLHHIPSTVKKGEIWAELEKQSLYYWIEPNTEVLTKDQNIIQIVFYCKWTTKQNHIYKNGQTEEE